MSAASAAAPPELSCRRAPRRDVTRQSSCGTEIRSGYRGRGVLKAVANVNTVIGPAIKGMDSRDQEGLDGRLLELDGTTNKSRLGANAILGVSIAVARAAAEASDQPLWRHLRPGGPYLLPLPMMNIISGAARGSQPRLPGLSHHSHGAHTVGQALEMATAVYDATRRLLAGRGLSTLKADEGGFGPALEGNRKAVELLLEAIELAGYRPGAEVVIAVDVAASHFFNGTDKRYHLTAEAQAYDAAGMVAMLAKWVDDYPIVSIEDGLAEDDWAGWQALTARLDDRVQLIGDDLLTTNPMRLLRRAIKDHAANAVLVKMNQIGTLSETLDVIDMAQHSDFRAPVVSGRSGETEDCSTVADLAVATAAGQIKIGLVAQSERLAKYNQLLRIEEALRPQRCLRRQETGPSWVVASSRSGSDCVDYVVVTRLTACSISVT